MNCARISVLSYIPIRRPPRPSPYADGSSGKLAAGGPRSIGKIGIAGFAPAGSAELVAEVEKVADSDVIFLQNHGVITYGPDIYEAFSRMDAVENTAKTILYSQSLGDVREF